jgi:hypothetical protein
MLRFSSKMASHLHQGSPFCLEFPPHFPLSAVCLEFSSRQCQWISTLLQIAISEGIEGSAHFEIAAV